MSSHTKKVIAATSDGIRYDAKIKQVFSSKQVLARIIKPIIPELSGMKEEEVERRIEAVELDTPVSPYGNPDKIVGSATEDRVVGEGNVDYDIRFSVLCPDEKKRECQVLIDLEAQGTPNPGYHLARRATYYVSRMISSQLTNLSDETAYDDLQKVYSIWICFSKDGIKDAITEAYMAQRCSYGNYRIPKHHLDLIHIVFVRISNDGFLKGLDNDLLQFLGTLLAPSLKVEERVKRLKEFIPDPEFEKEAREMFGFTEMIRHSLADDVRDEVREEVRKEVREEAHEEGRKEERQALLRGMLSHASIAEVSRITGIPEDEIECIVKQ